MNIIKTAQKIRRYEIVGAIWGTVAVFCSFMAIVLALMASKESLLIAAILFAISSYGGFYSAIAVRWKKTIPNLTKFRIVQTALRNSFPVIVTGEDKHMHGIANAISKQLSQLRINHFVSSDTERFIAGSPAKGKQGILGWPDVPSLQQIKKITEKGCALYLVMRYLSWDCLSQKPSKIQFCLVENGENSVMRDPSPTGHDCHTIELCTKIQEDSNFYNQAAEKIVAHIFTNLNVKIWAATAPGS